jgi:20S proteasome subunit beta 7
MLTYIFSYLNADLAVHQYQIATITDKGVDISESRTLDTYWSFAEGIRGYGAQTQ